MPTLDPYRNVEPAPRDHFILGVRQDTGTPFVHRGTWDGRMTLEAATTHAFGLNQDFPTVTYSVVKVPA